MFVTRPPLAQTVTPPSLQGSAAKLKTLNGIVAQLAVVEALPGDVFGICPRLRPAQAERQEREEEEEEEEG